MTKLKKITSWIKGRLALSIFIALILLLALGFAKQKYYSNFNKPNKISNKTLASCGISSVPESVTLKNEPMTINHDNLQDDTWATFEHEDFSVLYPRNRNLYGQAEGFNLCPEGHCQDREMYISTLNQEDACSNIKYYLDEAQSLQSEYHLVLWTNLTINQYEGVVLTINPVNPLDPDPLYSGLVGIIAEDGRKYDFGAKFNETHLNIMSSFEVKK